MSKKLSEMTLEELWQLFPVILTEHRDGYTEAKSGFIMKYTALAKRGENDIRK